MAEKIDLVLIGNVLGGLALAFLIDNVAMGGIVTKTMPVQIVAIVGYVIFVGVLVYGFKQLKKLN